MKLTIESLTKIPAIRQAIADADAAEVTDNTNRRLALINEYKSAEEVYSKEYKDKEAAEAAVKEARNQVIIQSEKLDKQNENVIRALSSLQKVKRALDKEGESELMAGIGRISAHISNTEKDIKTARDSEKTGWQFGESNEAREKRIRDKYSLNSLVSQVSVSQRILGELVALKMSPINPDEMRGRVKSLLAGAGLLDVDKMNELLNQKLIKSCANMTALNS